MGIIEKDKLIYSKIQAIALSFLAILAFGILLNMTKFFLVPFVVAVLLAYMFSPLVQKLETMRIPTILAMLIILLIIFIVLVLIGFAFYNAFDSIKEKIPFYVERFKVLFSKVAIPVDNYLDLGLSPKKESVTARQLFEILSPSYMLSTLNNSVGSFINFFSKMTIIMLFLIFLLTSRKVFIKKAYKIFQADEGTDNYFVIKKITAQVRYFLLLKSVISLGTGAVFGFAAFAFGIDSTLR